jgi:hypothetical protein
MPVLSDRDRERLDDTADGRFYAVVGRIEPGGK